jgi:hypothetical protein
VRAALNSTPIERRPSQRSNFVQAERLESAFLCRCPFLLTPVELVPSHYLFVFLKARYARHHKPL